MITLDEDALICDLAETYQIYDYKQLPVSKVAVFSCGLRENSRIKMLLSNQSVSLENLLIAGISDKLSLLLWGKTKDGQKGVNRPISILETLTNQNSAKENVIVFNTGEEFDKTRRALLGGGS